MYGLLHSLSEVTPGFRSCSLIAMHPPPGLRASQAPWLQIPPQTPTRHLWDTYLARWGGIFLFGKELINFYVSTPCILFSLLGIHLVHMGIYGLIFKPLTEISPLSGLPPSSVPSSAANCWSFGGALTPVSPWHLTHCIALPYTKSLYREASSVRAPLCFCPNSSCWAWCLETVREVTCLLGEPGARC